MDGVYTTVINTYAIIQQLYTTRINIHCGWVVRGLKFTIVQFQEVLRTNDGVFWLDATVRLATSTIEPLYKASVDTGGILHFRAVPHPNIASVSPHIYSYIPTDLESQRHTLQTSTAAVLVYNTETMFWNVLIWWYLCALEPGCQAGTVLERCDNRHSQRGDSPSCTLFDQSVLSLLESNFYGYNFDRYFYSGTNKSRVIQPIAAKSNYKLRKC